MLLVGLTLPFLCRVRQHQILTALGTGCALPSTTIAAVADNQLHAFSVTTHTVKPAEAAHENAQRHRQLSLSR
jgi:hypothetical protein